MVLNLLFGQVSLLDHVRLIPVFAMASSFLTAAWPPLLQSLGQRSVTPYDMTAPLDSISIPVSQTYADDEVFNFLPNTSNGSEHSFQALQTDSNSPSPVSTTFPTQFRNTQPVRQPTSSHTIPHELIQMGPPSTYSGGTYQSGTSLSLCSRPGPPSEMSSIVATNFFPELTADRLFDTTTRTQRRRDIQSLGRGPYSGDNAHKRAEGGEDRPSSLIVNMVLRKVQSI